MKSEAQLGYTGAMVDGEGHISLCYHKYRKGYSRHSLAVGISNTDERLMIWLKSIWGTNYHPQWKKGSKWDKGTRMCYIWGVTDKKAELFLKEIYPYLLLKKAQAELALAFRKTIGKRGWTGRGKPLPQNIWEKRQQLALLVAKLNKGEK